jgi:hypothetical protein
MTRKKSQESGEPKFVVKKREPKAKPDYFQNVTPFAHPLAEIINFPATLNNLDQFQQSSDSSSQEENNLGSIVSSGLLPELINPASRSASRVNSASKLAPLNQESASLLAEENNPASRSPLQLLADLRQSVGSRIQVAIRIRPEIKHLIDVFIAEQGISQQDFFELAASSFIEDSQMKLADLKTKGASLLAHDDLMRLDLWKTVPSIINLHLQYNKHLKWKPADDEVAQKFNSVDIRIIEIGIVQTQFNAHFKKINSFKYYVSGIELAIEECKTVKDTEVYLQFIKDIYERNRDQKIKKL